MFLIESCESFPVFLDSSLENSPEKRELLVPKTRKIEVDPKSAKVETEKAEKEAPKKRGRTPKKKTATEESKKAEEIQKLPENCAILQENPAPRKRPNRASKKSYHESLSDESLIEEMSLSGTSSPEKQSSPAPNNQSKTPKIRKVGRPPKKSKDPPATPINEEKSVRRPSRTPKKNYQESDESLVDEDLLPELSPEKDKSPKESTKKRHNKKAKGESKEKPSSASSLDQARSQTAPKHQGNFPFLTGKILT